MTVYVVDLVVTRLNQRDLTTTKGVAMSNRHTFTVTAISEGGGLTVTGDTGTVTLPAMVQHDLCDEGFGDVETQSPELGGGDRHSRPTPPPSA